MRHCLASGSSPLGPWVVAGDIRTRDNEGFTTDTTEGRETEKGGGFGKAVT